jgi:hypothetical protein
MRWFADVGHREEPEKDSADRKSPSRASRLQESEEFAISTARRRAMKKVEQEYALEDPGEGKRAAPTVKFQRKSSGAKPSGGSPSGAGIDEANVHIQARSARSFVRKLKAEASRISSSSSARTEPGHRADDPEDEIGDPDTERSMIEICRDFVHGPVGRMLLLQSDRPGSRNDEVDDEDYWFRTVSGKRFVSPVSFCLNGRQKLKGSDQLSLSCKRSE